MPVKPSMAILLLSFFSQLACADIQERIADPAHANLDPNFTYMGSNKVFNIYYDRRIEFDAQRQQVTAYLLIEAKVPRYYKYVDKSGNSKNYKWRHMVQRTDFDCHRGIYIADFVTYLEDGSGQTIQEGMDGTPYKINSASLVEAVYKRVCSDLNSAN